MYCIGTAMPSDSLLTPGVPEHNPTPLLTPDYSLLPFHLLPLHIPLRLSILEQIIIGIDVLITRLGHINFIREQFR